MIQIWVRPGGRMSTVTRKQFVDDLSKAGINVNDMAPENKEKLKEAGMSEAQLAKMREKMVR